MVFDGEEHESLCVLAEQWLIGFLWLEALCNHSLDLCLLDILDDGLLDLDIFEDGRVGIQGLVLLVGSSEVELLRRGVTHLERFDASGSLLQT